MNQLEKRVIDISYKHKLSHISSCLTAVNVIDKIFEIKKPEDPFVLSAGHAGLALYVVLEKREGKDAEQLLLKHGVHPNRDEADGIHVSTGSLGQGLPIVVGMALANPSKTYYVLLTDGECAEGSIWEALRIAGDFKLQNLRVAVNANGTSAYKNTDVDWLDLVLQHFYPTMMVKTNLFALPSWLQGVHGHYVVLDEEKYKELTRT